MGDPIQPSLIIIAYLLFVYYGPKWMANRKPFDIQPVLVVYNFSMVIFCAYIVGQVSITYTLYIHLNQRITAYQATQKNVMSCGPL